MSPSLPFAGSDWFDPLEEAVRLQVRSFIEELLEEELEAALGRSRYERHGTASGHRHGRRPRQLVTTFGPVELSVPRARLRDEAGEREWKSTLLPAYKRLSHRAEALIAQAYLAGMNTRRVRRALAGLFAGRAGKDVVSRAWQRARSAWENWQKRDLVGEDIVRLILDGTVVKVRRQEGDGRLTVDRPRHPPRWPEGGAGHQEYGRRERGCLAAGARGSDLARYGQAGARDRGWW
jgi:transposase-like protein